jgi:short-subunit dehydrogenase
MPGRLEKTVLITGASSGIGRAAAIYMAERGFSVIGTSRSLDRLQSLKDEATRSDLSIAAVELDPNRDEAVDSVLPDLISEHGGIDVLVNNAGYILWGPVGSLSVAELKSQFETNLFACQRLIRAVLPGMIEGGQGTIINVSSVAGRLATPFTGAYAASKFALEGLSEALRTELWPLGVRVALVEPGLIRTDLQARQTVAREAESEGSPYAPYVARFRSRHRRFERFGRDPIKVARVIYKLARAQRPAFRNVVGIEASLGIFGKRLLPERLFQAMLTRATMR